MPLLAVCFQTIFTAGNPHGYTQAFGLWLPPAIAETEVNSF